MGFMHKMSLTALAVFAAALFSSGLAEAKDRNLVKEANNYFEPLPAEPEFTKDNPGNPDKIGLGVMLYFDTRLSKSNTISCNSCHNLATGGVDNNQFSIGHGWQMGGRNAPTVFNAALHITQFWDGRAADVEEQAAGPMQNPVEMAANSVLVETRLKSIPEYEEKFHKAFPREKDPVTLENAAKAIAAFERTLLTPGPFDDFLKGKSSALTSEQKLGLSLFMDKGCVSCHNGPAVGGNSYRKFGMVKEVPWLKDKGRYEVTHKTEDMYVFKVPSLRNVELTYPYFHNGKYWELKDAVEDMARYQLGAKLTKEEVEYIVSFLKSLTGDMPPLEIPALPPSTGSTPRPNPR